MEQAGTQTIASFTGTLLKRERAIENRFVQLVFREDDKDWLCVSTDLRTAALAVGQNYRIEGVFKQRGERAFVYDPKIALLKKHWRPIRRVVFVVALIVCIGALGGVAYMHQHSSSDTNTTQGTNVAPAVAPAATQTSASSPDTEQAAATAPTTTPAPAVTTDTSAPVTTTATTTPVKHTTKPATTKNTKSSSKSSSSTSNQGGTTGNTTSDSSSSADTSTPPVDTSTDNPPDPGTPDPVDTPPADPATDTPTS